MSIPELTHNNQEIARTFALMLEEGRLPHAIILEGASSSGKTSLARWLAQAALCSSTGNKPCGACSNCVKVGAGSHPDMLFLDGDENPRVFPIDTIRGIRSDASIKPNEAERKVYVLLGAQNMSESSQNALLKVFEEPPDNVVFILTASSATALLPTIRSRAQIFSLESEPSPEAEDLEYTAQVADAVLAPREAELLYLTAPLIKNKDKLRSTLAQLVLVFRDAAVLRAGGTACFSGQEETARKLANALTRGRLQALLETVWAAQHNLDRNANAALMVTAFCARLRSAAGR